MAISDRIFQCDLLFLDLVSVHRRPGGLSVDQVNLRLTMSSNPCRQIPGATMPKLSEYVEMAANEYLQETGTDELDAHWIAEFFQDSGVQDDFPRQDLVAFSAMVQKALTLKSERAGKHTLFQLDKIVHLIRQLRKP
jgi:hypothetical protein